MSAPLKERRITVANIADATCLSRPTIYSYIEKYDDGETRSLPDYIPLLFDAICDIYPDDFILGLLKIVHDEVTNPEYVKKKDRKGSESPDIDHAEAERVASDMEDHRQSIDGLKMKNVILDNTIESRSGIPATELDRLRVEYDDRKAEIIKLEDELNELKRHHDELIGHGTERPVMSLKDLITHTD